MLNQPVSGVPSFPSEAPQSDQPHAECIYPIICLRCLLFFKCGCAKRRICISSHIYSEEDAPLHVRKCALVGKFCSHIEGLTFVFLHLIPFSKATYAQGCWSGFQFIFIAKLSDIFDKSLFPQQCASQAVPRSYGEHRVKTFSSHCRLG